MNLTNALETLIDAARQLPENRQLNQAIKRVEQKVQTLRDKKALRDSATAIYASIEEANKRMEPCRDVPGGIHDWRLRHAEADYLACMCWRCHRSMRLHPDANPVPIDEWSQS